MALQLSESLLGHCRWPLLLLLLANDHGVEALMDISEYINSLPLDNLGKGKQFEKAIKWWLKSDAEWSSIAKNVWLWDEWPERWGVDRGIDLVFENQSGQLFAVQVKLRNLESQLPKSEIDSFLSESSRSIFTGRILVTTTEKFSDGARQAITAQEKPVVVIDYRRLSFSDLDWRKADENKTPQERTFRPLRPHQQKAIEEIIPNLVNTDRGQVVMACGSGKTMIALRLAEELAESLTLVLIPSLNLLGQYIRDWNRDRTKDFNWLSVCSDETVNADYEYQNSEVTIFDTPVTTNPQVIESFVSQPGRKVIFSTYASVEKVIQGSKAVEFDLLIADEAHRLAGVTRPGNLGIFHDSEITIKKRLYFTATPRIVTRNIQSKVSNLGYVVNSMDDEKLFGKVLASYSFKRAIDDGILANYEIVVSFVTSEDIKNLIRKDGNVEVEKDNQTFATLAAQAALLKAMNEFKISSIITFHSRVERAKKFAQTLARTREVLGVTQNLFKECNANYVAGDMPVSTRYLRLEKLKHGTVDSPVVISNARCLCEGIDIPELHGVAFIDPKQSQVDIVQAIGRAIRKKKDSQQKGYIIIPAFIDDIKNPAKEIVKTEFNTIWEIITAIGSHDSEFYDQLNIARTQIGKNGTSKLNVSDLGNIRLIGNFKLPADFFESLGVQIVRNTTDDWYEKFGMLLAYVDEFGNSDVPQEYETANGVKLGSWVGTQRITNSRGQLQKEKSGLLESQPGWIWNKLEHMRNNAKRQLLVYVEEFGTSRVPQGYIDKSGYNLGSFVTMLRKNKDDLSTEFKAELEALPDWSWKLQVDWWNEFIFELKLFNSKFGHCDVRDDYVSPNGYPLKKRLNSRRYSKAMISEERRLELEALPGWGWSRYEARNRTGIQLLTDFYAINSHVDFKKPYGELKYFDLTDWVRSKRVEYKEGVITQELIDTLESFEGWSWNPSELVEMRKRKKFEEGFAALITFIEEIGSSQVPRPFVNKDGFKLGKWVASIRSYYAGGYLLTKEDIERFEALPKWKWKPGQSGKISSETTQKILKNELVLNQKEKKRIRHDLQEQSNFDAWRAIYEEVQRYGLDNPEAPIPTPEYRTSDGKSLIFWLRTQKKKIEKDSLSPEYLKLWNELPHSKWFVPNENRFTAAEDRKAWYDSLFEMQKIAIQYPELRNIPNNLSFSRGVNILTWMNGYRYKYSQGKMDDQSIKEIEKIPGWWWQSVDSFKDWLPTLMEFIDEFGHSKVPQHYKTKDGKNLGTWVSNQRVLYKRGEMHSERIDALEKLPGWTWVALVRKKGRK
jgi:superfamily II DNA or RNA helicase